MQILELSVLSGPNYWSIRRPNLIQMKLDLEELEERPTNTINGFLERLKKMLPSMIEHHCSEGVRGGFFMRVKDGTWMGHVIEHLALELQSLAGMECGFGRTRSTGEREGVYYVVFECLEEEAGLYTARAAVSLAQALIDGTDYDLEADIQQLRDFWKATRLDPFTSSIVAEAAKRNIPYIRLNKDSLIQLGYGVHQKRIRVVNASTTLSIEVEEASGNIITIPLPEAAEVPVTNGMMVRHEAQPVMDKLFPKGSDGRIPIIAVTGTSGKTITTHITAHIARTAGKKVGFTTSDGIYIPNQQMIKSNTTGPATAQLVLKNPTVDFAVLACARDGILKGGLGFQQSHVAIVTNVAAENLGMDGIHSVERLVRLKQVVPETVSKGGYAILNADDDLVYGMKDELDCKIALFCMNGDHPRIQEHSNKGGKACVYENGYITLLKENRKERVLPANDIPFTEGGKAAHHIAHVLPAVLSTWLFNDISIDDIRQALLTFIPSAAIPPGPAQLLSA